MVIPLLIGVFIAYILGSIPTSLWSGLLLKKIDIREHGSGNVGATNAVRVLGVKIGLPVLLLDIFKGWISIHIGKLILLANSIEIKPLYLIVLGLAAICGHIFTIFLKFKGGKGVATSAGVFIYLTPFSILAALAVFILTAAVTRYVSLGSILAALALLISQLVRVFVLGKNEIEYLVLVVLIVVFVIVRHKSNIKRLAAGNENKLTFGKKS